MSYRSGLELFLVRHIVPAKLIERGILVIRRHKVILDEHLAFLYDVEVKVLNQAVRWNIQRFLADFMFQLSSDETAS